jgi:hypothetical protein
MHLDIWRLCNNGVAHQQPHELAHAAARALGHCLHERVFLRRDSHADLSCPYGLPCFHRALSRRADPADWLSTDPKHSAKVVLSQRVFTLHIGIAERIVAYPANLAR